MIKNATVKVWAASIASRIFGHETHSTQLKLIAIQKGKSTLSGLNDGQIHLQKSSKVETRHVCSNTKIVSIDETPEIPANKDNTAPTRLICERNRIISEIFAQDTKRMLKNDTIGNNMGHINVGLFTIDQINMDDLNDERSIDELFVSDFLDDYNPPVKQEKNEYKDYCTIYKDNYRTSLWFESVLMNNPDGIGDKCGICDEPDDDVIYDMSGTLHSALELSYIIDIPPDEPNDKLAAPSDKHALVTANVVTHELAVIPDEEENKTKVKIPHYMLQNHEMSQISEMSENAQLSKSTETSQSSLFMSTDEVPYWNSIFETACGEDYPLDSDSDKNVSNTNKPKEDTNLQFELTEWIKNKKEPQGILFKRFKSVSTSAATFFATESKEVNDKNTEIIDGKETPATMETSDESCLTDSEEFQEKGFLITPGELDLAKEGNATVEDEVAKRCLNSASDDCIDTKLLKEMKKTGIIPQDTGNRNDC